MNVGTTPSWEKAKPEYVEVDHIKDKTYELQAAVEFFSMDELLKRHPKSFFDTHGNLCLMNELGLPITHLAPAFFSYLGQVLHVARSCGFMSEEKRILIKQVLNEEA